MNQYLRDIFATHGEIPPVDFHSPVFIIGLMRSGTTYLANMISKHPQLLQLGFELNEAWTKIGGASAYDRIYKNENDASFEYSNNMTAYFTRFIQESKGFKRHIMRLQSKYLNGVGRIFYDWQHIIPLNKCPHLINRINYITTIYPNARIIFIIRSIEGHSSSMKVHFDHVFSDLGICHYMPDEESSSWFNIAKGRINEYPENKCYPGNFSVIPEMWIRLNHLALKELKQLPEEKRIILNYEDLINKPEIILPAIFDFIGTLPKYNNDVYKITHKKIKKKNTTTKGDPLTKWKKYLSENEIQMIHQAIKKESIKYNTSLELLNDLKITI
ncbi:sulfotransferase [Bacteroidota bacterium]